MADARGDAGAAAGDVVELQGQGAVTADVGGVHGGAGKLTTAMDVAGSASSAEGDGVERRSPSRYPRCAACAGAAGICTCLAFRVSFSIVALVRL